MILINDNKRAYIKIPAPLLSNYHRDGSGDEIQRILILA